MSTLTSTDSGFPDPTLAIGRRALRSRRVWLLIALSLLTARVTRSATAPLKLEASLAVRGGQVLLAAQGAPPTSEVCFSWRPPESRKPYKPLGCAVTDGKGRSELLGDLPPAPPRLSHLEFLASVRGDSENSATTAQTVLTPGNVLILLADDLGVDKLGIYGATGAIPATPTIDALAAAGMRFDRAYSAPNCSPTRAAIMTGRQQWRTGVGTALHEAGKAYLRADEGTLPEMLDVRTGGSYRHAAIGKWHLGSDKLRGVAALEQGLTTTDGTFNFENNPTMVHGWETFAGTLLGADYFSWDRWTGDRTAPLVSNPETTYTTIVHIDEAIDKLAEFGAEPERPWLMYVAFNAPHAVYECPPSPPFVLSGPCTTNKEKYNLMVEAIDAEIDRLLTVLDGDYPDMAANTTVIFLGDNGTPNHVGSGADQLKGTIYEGGIHVPLIVRSPLIPAASQGAVTQSLVHAVDFLATIAEIAGAPLSARQAERHGLDSQSFVATLQDPGFAARAHVVSELFETPGLREVLDTYTRPKHHRAILNQDWKLHVEYAGAPTLTWTECLYDLRGVDVEGTEVCSGSEPAARLMARGPAAANCAAHSTEAAAAYRELRAIERAVQEQVDPLHGHCGNESMDCPIELPVRVMPRSQDDFTSGDYAVDRWFRLTADEIALAGGGSLNLQGHGLGYRDGHVVDGALKKDGKASVKLGGCDWIELNNDRPERILEPERHYGGIGGGFRTVRLRIPLADMGPSCLEEGFNRIQFRFNGSDGVSSGYRILAFNVHDAANQPILPPEAFVEDDPDDWQAPFTDLASISLGQSYFERRRFLVESPLDTAMTNSACFDCHTADGRDLEYYAYSNDSIVNRAVFHGLTINQGEQIASYIRSHPAPRLGRPWNPPYQPGAGIDTRSDAAGRWAAGAGLEGVLDDERAHASEILDSMFPSGWADSATIAAQLRGEGLDARTINLREIPIAIQLPDWNSWLPEKHPFDLWGRPYYDCTQDPTLASCPERQLTDNPLTTIPVFTPERSYLDIRAALEAGILPSDVPTILGKLEDDVRLFIDHETTLDMGSEWRALRSLALDAAVGAGYASDFTKRSLAQWMAVKYWELAHEFGLEALGPEVYGAFGDDGELRSWPFGNRQSVHAIAPHITSSNRNHLQLPLAAEIAYQTKEYDPAATGVVSLYCSDWCLDEPTQADQAACFETCDYPDTHAAQTPLKGDYDSTAWYHLQMILHSGARNPEALGTEPVKPVDWPYSLKHVDDLPRAVAEESGAEVWESLRFVATLAKAYQMRDNGIGPALTGWAMREVSPRLLVGNYDGFVVEDELWDHLGDYLPGHPDLRTRIGEAFLHAFLDVTFPEEGDFHYTPELVDAFDNWKQWSGDPSGIADWWKLDPADVVVDFVAPFHSEQGSLGAPRCPKPIHGLGTGDPSADPNHKEFRTEPFQHAAHVYRTLPWLVNLGFEAGLLTELALWAAEKWPANDWLVAPLAGLNCP